MPSYNLPQYDRGPGALASLVGGLIGGAETGYSARRRMTTDKQSDADAERKRLMDAIRLRIEIENAGYDPDDLTAGQSPAKEGGTFAPASPKSPGPKPGGTPPFVDPRNYGDASPELPGFAGLDPYQAPRAEEVANPFRIQQTISDPGIEQRVQDPRSRVADILFQGVPKMRRGESAAERAARVQDERIGARESSRDSAFMARQQGELEARAREGGLDRTSRESMNDADNRTALAAARIAAASRVDVAELRPGSSSDPNVRRVQNLLTAQNNIVKGLDTAIRQTEAQIPKQPPLGMSPDQFQAQYGQYIAAADQLRQRRASEDQKRITLANQLTQALAMPALPGAAPVQGDPRVDMRGRPLGGTTGRPAMVMPTPAPGQPQVQPPAGATPQAGAKRPLSQAERAKAASDPGFQQFLSSKGYGPADWQ